MDQLILPITLEQRIYSHFDFAVTNSNLQCYRALISDKPWPNGRILIIGDEGSGKTHLAKIWQRNSSASMIYSIDDYHENSNAKCLIFEDIEYANERELFGVINLTAEHGQQLLLTCGRYGQFLLPDLRSRLAATYKTIIKGPDEYLTRIIISKTMHDLQNPINDDTLNYLAPRIYRSFKNIRDFCNKLHYITIQRNKPISLKLVRQALMLTQSTDEILL